MPFFGRAITLDERGEPVAARSTAGALRVFDVGFLAIESVCLCWFLAPGSAVSLVVRPKVASVAVVAISATFAASLSFLSGHRPALGAWRFAHDLCRLVHDCALAFVDFPAKGGIGARHARPNKSDAGNGSYGICRVIDASHSPSPEP